MLPGAKELFRTLFRHLKITSSEPEAALLPPQWTLVFRLCRRFSFVFF
jgi:hypothetical protein